MPLNEFIEHLFFFFFWPGTVLGAGDSAVN